MNSDYHTRTVAVYELRFCGTFSYHKFSSLVKFDIRFEDEFGTLHYLRSQ